ncbi:isoprenylcysteine carboxylmethyltransferase family protein [Melioribacteraceae bacterium 4301-Me]|uniref:methyltransferase family protein n=1 Tax=Pyranulibacter aquaticus TaxID=3163344 RepID=UPI00359B4671
MSFLLDVLLIILLFTFFGFSHTFLASNKVKRLIAQRAGNLIAFYRLFYNISSLIIFMFVYFEAPKPDIIIYDLHYPYDIITFAFQIISLFGLLWAARSVDVTEFLGVAQIKRYLNKEYNAEELDEIQRFNTKGAYKYMRHPIYFFSILFLSLRPTMDLFYLVMLICIIIYFYVGSIFEEKKLVEKFGDEYIEYQKRVPRIIPIKLHKR